MKQENYNLIVKAVTMGLPVVAKEVIQDLNASLQELDQLKQSNNTEENQVDNKEEQ